MTMNVARWVYVVLLVAMAGGQILDFPAFRAILREYDIVPAGATAAMAVLLVAGEMFAAVALARRSTAAAGALIMLAVAIAWTALGTQAFVRGLVLDNCGCFGKFFGQELRWWVLLQDAIWLVGAAYLAFGRWLGRRQRSRSTGIGPQPVHGS